MTLPTGGQVTYGYGNTTPPNQVNRWLTSRIADGNTWNFLPTFTSCTAPCSPLTVTVTTPPYSDGTTTASDNHVYSFFDGNAGAWPSQIQYFRGPATGTPVTTLTKEYDNGQNNSCTLPMGDFVMPVLVRETLTWPTASGTLSKKAEYCYDSSGINLLKKKMWDYQPNGNFAASPDREIDNTYVTDPAYVGANILTLLKTTAAKDAGGNQVAQTTYGYDEYTTQGLSLQPSGVTTQHNIPSGPRGNLTSVSRWLNTAPTPVVGTMAWYDTGEVYKRTDPLGHGSTTTYDATGAYPGTVCNALNQCSYSGYDFNTGLLTIATDANGTQLGDPLHTTTYSYDSMLRPLCTNLPDGGQTCLSYPDPNTTKRQQKITSALSDFSSTILDGLGRVIQTQHSLPTCTAKTDTTYDPLGRIFSVSNPYCTTSETTYGVTQTYYDALSRPLSVIEQDGSPKAITYSANCKTITDERGNSRRLCSNGFGELIEVDEPNSSAQGTSATASVTISGSLGSAGSGTGSAPVPLSGSPLTSFVAPDGSSHIFYIATGQHVLHMFWNSTGGWQDEDLFSTTGAVPATNSVLSGVALTDGTLHVFYTGANQHIYQFVYASGGWQSQDLTAVTGNVLAASGTALASDAGAAGEPVHLYYLGTNQHIYCLFISGTTWQNQDLTAATGNTPAAAGTKLAVSVLTDGTTRLFYLGTNQHVYQLFRNNGGSFGTPYLASTDYTDAQGWNSSAYYPSIRLADVNGDGKPDVCGRGQTGVGCSLNNGSGSFAARQQWETSFTDGFGWNQLPYGSTFMFADLNGDHKADVCARGISGIICEPSTGAAFGASYSATGDYTDAQGWNSPYYYPSLRLADINGDGKPDVCGRGSGGISCSLNSGTGSFGPYQQWGTNFTDANGWNQPPYTSTIMFADINGDGKADVCGRGGGGISCFLSTGSSFGTSYLATSDFSDSEGWNNAAYYPSIRLADVNGDGKPDVCGRGATGVVCALNNGNGTFGTARQWDGNFTDAGGWNLPQYTSTIIFADINGDGRADLCGKGGAGIWCALSTGNASWQNQDLTAITGNTLAIAGGSLTSDAGAAGNPVHLYYIGASQHIYSLYWNSSTLAWTNFDITANTGNTLPATGSQLSASVASDGTTHVFYLGSNQHIYQLLCCTSNWQNQDLTAIAGNTLALTGTALTSTGLAGGGNITHLYYQSGTLHLNHLSLGPSSSWTNEDLSLSESTLVPDSGIVSMTAAGFTASACFGPSTNPACSGQQLNDTTSAVASALAQALNATGSTVSATAVGSTINFTLLQPGPFTLPIAALTTAHDNSSLFTNPSFTSPATNFANGAGTSFTNGYTTLYSHDGLGNLTCVEQHGDASSGTGCSAPPTSDATSPWRIRRFTYDSLSRLLTAKNPESGTISYTYDPDGNLVQKISPAPNQTGTATQTLSYCYDALHRFTDKSYTAQAPVIGQPCTLTGVVVHQAYDTGANSIGHLTSLTDQAGSGLYTYDNLGRMLSDTRVLSGISKPMSYEYNLDGSLSKLHYPSSRVVTYTPWNNGTVAVSVPMQATDGNGTQYVSNASFYANLAEYQRFMPGIYFRTDLNSRLQISGFYSDNGQINSFFMNKSYSYGPAHRNNGDVISIINNKDSSRTQTFAYDALNRITSGSSAANTGALSWGENYTVDAWGNLQMSPMAGKASGGAFQCAANLQNQPTCLGYDVAGNLTNYTAPGQYVYDPENRLQSTAGASYMYDSQGDRVLKNGSIGRMYWYGNGNVLAESDAAGNLTSEYVFFSGKRTARIDLPANSVHYYLSDHLNSTSMVISSAGAIEEESDYTPFGTQNPIIATGNHYKFTGKERDTESQLDYFGARYYSSALGRFISADWSDESDPLPYADLSNPQTLNLYSYVTNNPETFTDEDGHKMDCTSETTYGPGHIPIGNITTCVVTLDPDPSIPILWQPGINYGHGNLSGGCPLGTCHTFNGLFPPLRRDFPGFAVFLMGLGTMGSLPGSSPRGGAAPVLQGAAGVQRAIEEIEAEGGTVIGTNVTIRTGQGKGKIIADILYRDADGNLTIGESKNGPSADYNGNQRAHGYANDGHGEWHNCRRKRRASISSRNSDIKCSC